MNSTPKVFGEGQVQPMVCEGKVCVPCGLLLLHREHPESYSFGYYIMFHLIWLKSIRNLVCSVHQGASVINVNVQYIIYTVEFNNSNNNELAGFNWKTLCLHNSFPI